MAGGVKPEHGISQINYRRILNFPKVVALGSLVTVGLAVFLMVDPILNLVGSETPLAYTLFVLFFIPVILALTERASVTRGDGGIFNLAKTSKFVALQYWTGWLIIGGYLCLGAIFAYFTGSFLSDTLTVVADFSVDGRLLAIALIVIVGLTKLRGGGARWGAKSTVIYLCFLVVLLIVFYLWVNPVESSRYWAAIPLNDPLAVVPLLAMGMWGISFIMDHREVMKHPRRRMLANLSVPLLLGGAIGIIISTVLLQYSGIVAQYDRPLLFLAGEIGSLVQILLATAFIIITLAGLSQTITSTLRLTTAFSQQGFIPKQTTENGRGSQLYFVIPISLLLILIVILLPINMVVGGASAALMFALALAIGQDIFSKTQRLPEYRRFKLPLHPLFPIISVFICLAMALAQPIRNEVALFAWIIVGIGYYYFRGRKGAVATRQEGVVLKESDFEHARVANGVMIYLADLDETESLLQVGVTLARERSSPLLVLHVVEYEDEKPKASDRENVRASLEKIKETLSAHNTKDISPIPLVRMASNLADGISATIWDEQVSTLVLGWPIEQDDQSYTVDVLDYLIAHLPCEVAISRGKLSHLIDRVLVPMTSQAHSQAALIFAQDLTRQDDGQVDAGGIVRGRASQDAMKNARTYIQSTVSKLDKAGDFQTKIFQLDHFPDDLSDVTHSYDLIIFGASEEGFLRPTTFSGYPVQAVDAAAIPSVIIKKREKVAEFWLRMGWETLLRFMPKLNRQKRAAVYRTMNQNARADVDFYVLISLAAGIAFLGLLLNSSSVIIGAMLIAPLMNPILATGHSLVMGNLRMLRTAINSMLRGVLLAIGISAIFALFLFSLRGHLEPTDEILSRTSPNLLDLLVALLSGAAAAYAVSRSQLAAALPGVAIAAALVPPLCVVGFGLGTGRFDIALGSGLLFITNLAAIVVAAAFIFLLLGFRPPVRIERGERARQGLTVALLALLAVSIVLLIVTVITTRAQNDRGTIQSMVNTAWAPDEAQVQNIVIVRQRQVYIVDFTVLDYTNSITQSELDDLQQDIEQSINSDVILRASIVDSNLNIIEGTPQPTATVTPTVEPMMNQPSEPVLAPKPTSSLSPTLETSETPLPEPIPAEADPQILTSSPTPEQTLESLVLTPIPGS